jgi:hypothetical protein
MLAEANAYVTAISLSVSASVSLSARRLGFLRASSFDQSSVSESKIQFKYNVIAIVSFMPWL